jgi:acyl transferase domain-containing protein
MTTAPPAAKLAFTFPGQGSFQAEVLRQLYDGFQYREQFSRADEIAAQILGYGFLPLVESHLVEERDRILQACPDLDQVAIYVTNYLIAKQLIDSGLRPDLLLGHSFGELAALAVAGVYSFETGLRIVCQRSAVLRQFTTGGKMAAISCGAERTAEVLRSLGKPSLAIAVVNHARQTVVSGLEADLNELTPVLARQGVSLTLLKSRYPFHSALLQPGVEPFRVALCSYSFLPAAIPVYLCTEGAMYASGTRLPVVLSEQFVKPMNFAAILGDLHRQSFRKFVECGAGNIVTKVVQASALEGIVARAAGDLAEGPVKGCAAVLHEFGAQPGTAQPTASGELADLAREMRATLERATRALETRAFEARAFDTPASSPQASEERTFAAPDEFTGDVEPCEAEPIAIVAMGCLLPGAHNPEQYWNNILTGVSGIVDLSLEDPVAAGDFLIKSSGSELKIVSDKSYALLTGSVGTITYDAGLLAGSYSEAEFKRLTRAEKLLALASAQAFAGLRPALAAVPAERIECVLGSTADGSGDYDNAIFRTNVEEILEDLEPDQARRKAFVSSLRRIWPEPAEDNPRAPQNESCESVIRASAGRPIRTYIIDAACSSSLYAIGLGATALQEHAKDVMIVGGVFSPGPTNSPLFAQFRGLSPTESRPLDVAADGVIFGEGAGILILKRLSDAIESADPILGVIRGVGISSDGRSPAINVPQSRGQSIAIRRAYDASHIDTNSIQYVEAHATATPVGDAVEFEALAQAITRDPALPRIELGSVKALIGHTGWAAGAASVIKLCQAFKARTLPPQYHYNSPNPGIALASSVFHVSTKASPWPANLSSLPRRAAINGFGFGGTNAHLILEEFHPAYHRKLCAASAGKTAKHFRKPLTLAVIDAAALFPAESGLGQAQPGAVRAFERSELHLPKGKRLLPDVTDHMDPGQYLAALAAERAFEKFGEQWKQLRASTGVVLGVESKTERGVQSNQRLFLDRVKRLMTEDRVADGLPPGARAALVENLSAAVRKRVIPSGPYTLPGLMPNVISGRVANMFDLNGPNVVIDMGANSLFQSILVARDFLTHGDCKAVLAGGLNAVRMSKDDAEAVFLMLVTTEDTARELTLPVTCFLTTGDAQPDAVRPAWTPVSYRGAEGAIDLMDAIAASRDGKREIKVAEPRPTAGAATLVFRPVVAAETASTPMPASKPAPEPAPSAAAYAYVRGTPIYHYTPVETAVPLPPVTRRATARKILFLTDQPEQWKLLEQTGALGPFDYSVLCAQPATLANSIPIDLAHEETVANKLAALTAPFDTVVPVKFLSGDAADTLVTVSGDVLGLTGLLFAVCRQSYEAFQAGKIALGALSLGAFVDGKLNPFTGLVAGFVKSFARELPAATCRSVNVAETNFSKAMAILDAELSHRGPAVEVCYRGEDRFEIQLALLESVSSGNTSKLDANSVVFATGGGRGVTAVLAEEILTRFGCTVIAVGRTDPSTVPAEILNMDAVQLAAFEPEFYRRELAKGGKKIIQLRDLFRSYQAGHEVHENVQQLSRLPGRFEYISADMTNGDVAAAVVDSVFRKHGRLDMVLHGAGIQVSKVLTKKTIGEFRSVVGTKIASLQHIYRACEKLRAGRPVQYHLLTSAFSYMGNDGQPDYGSANEALNRLADVMSAPDGAPAARWYSVAWLGWAGIGMTRGSESAALGASRGLRGISKSEGQEIFARFLTGEPNAAVNILMADGELKFYRVATTASPFKPASRPLPAKKDRLLIERTVTLADAPYILNHRVEGVPTLPGAYLIMIVAEAALQLRPNLKINAYEDVAFRRFLRMQQDAPLKLRLDAKVLSEDSQGALVRVQVLSDFTHKNGMVLQKDAVYFEMSTRMSRSVSVQNGHSHNGVAQNGNGNGHSNGHNGNGSHHSEGRMLYDPYVAGGSPVQLNGPFRTLQNIVVGDHVRTAEYRPEEEIQESEYRGFLANLLIMDSLWRFGTIDLAANDALPVYIPMAGKVMKIYYDLTNPLHTATLLGKLYMAGNNPRLDHELLEIGPIEARDANGALLLSVEGGVCRKFGEVRNGHS